MHVCVCKIRKGNSSWTLNRACADTTSSTAVQSPVLCVSATGPNDCRTHPARGLKKLVENTLWNGSPFLLKSLAQFCRFCGPGWRWCLTGLRSGNLDGHGITLMFWAVRKSLHIAVWGHCHADTWCLVLATWGLYRHENAHFHHRIGRLLVRNIQYKFKVHSVAGYTHLSFEERNKTPHQTNFGEAAYDTMESITLRLDDANFWPFPWVPCRSWALTRMLGCSGCAVSMVTNPAYCYDVGSPCSWTISNGTMLPSRALSNLEMTSHWCLCFTSFIYLPITICFALSLRLG